MVQSGLILFEEKYVLGQWDSVLNTRQKVLGKVGTLVRQGNLSGATRPVMLVSWIARRSDKITRRCAWQRKGGLLWYCRAAQAKSRAAPAQWYKEGVVKRGAWRFPIKTRHHSRQA